MFENEPTYEERMAITDQMKRAGIVTREQWELGDVLSMVTGRVEEPHAFDLTMDCVETDSLPIFYPPYYAVN